MDRDLVRSKAVIVEKLVVQRSTVSALAMGRNVASIASAVTAAILSELFFLDESIENNDLFHKSNID